MDADSCGVLAEVVRAGMVESVHHGALVGLDKEGGIVMRVGDPATLVLTRSAWKPVQAAAMVQAGLDLGTEELAVVCSSHSGQKAHLDRVSRVLLRAGASPRELQNRPDYPLDPSLRMAALCAGNAPAVMWANCSGKHAGMLATCRANGWPLVGYLEPSHPLQDHILRVSRSIAPDVHFVGADGCGAPGVACRLLSLARAYRAVALGQVAGSSDVTSAMTTFPVLAAGRGRISTGLMEAFPGVMVKDGAEGVFAAVAPDGRAIAVKVADGSSRPIARLLESGLRRLGLTSRRSTPVRDETTDGEFQVRIHDDLRDR